MNGLLHHFISIQKMPVQKCFLGSCSRKETTICVSFLMNKLNYFLMTGNLKTVALLNRKLKQKQEWVSLKFYTCNWFMGYTSLVENENKCIKNMKI